MRWRRDLYLIRKKEKWFIAFKATGQLNGQAGKIIAWLRDHDDSYICEVGNEDQIENLPSEEITNFFGDQFNFTIDETDEKGNKIRRLAGSENAGAAQAAFDYYMMSLPSGRHMRLRQGARIMRKAFDGEEVP